MGFLRAYGGMQKSTPSVSQSHGEGAESAPQVLGRVQNLHPMSKVQVAQHCQPNQNGTCEGDIDCVGWLIGQYLRGCVVLPACRHKKRRGAEAPHPG